MSASARRTASPAGLSIVLPAYNEAGNIRAAVENALWAGEKVASEYEVIVVNDGSRDATSEMVEALKKKDHSKVRLLNHRVNLGYGAALRSGFKHSRYGLVFFTDSDNQFDMAELARFTPMLRDHDLIVGYRINRCDPIQRIVFSWFYNALVGLLFRVNVRDVNCAFKLMTQELVQNVTLECDDFFINAELIAKSRRQGFKIAEMGVRHKPRAAGKSSVKLSDVPRTLSTLITMWWRMRRAAPVAPVPDPATELVVQAPIEVASGPRPS